MFYIVCMCVYYECNLDVGYYIHVVIVIRSMASVTTTLSFTGAMPKFSVSFTFCLLK